MTAKQSPTFLLRCLRWGGDTGCSAVNLRWFFVILNWLQNSLYRRLILNISREKLVTGLFGSHFKNITLYQYQPVTRDLHVDLYSGSSIRYGSRSSKNEHRWISISWLTHRCKSLMDSCAVLGSGWLMVVNEKLVPRVERKIALSVAARDTAIEW